MMRRFTDNARYAKSRHFVRNRNFNGTKLIGRDRGECAARRDLLDGLLVIPQEVEQKPCWGVGLWSKRSKATSDTNFTVSNVDHSNGCANTNQNITGFRHFRRSIRFDRRTPKLKVTKVNLPLVKLDTITLVQGISSGGLSHA